MIYKISKRCRFELPLPRTATFLLLSLVVVFPMAIQADVVKWTDENGNVHYGDVVPEKYQDNAKTIDTTPANILESQHKPAFPKTERTQIKEKKSQNNFQKNASQKLKSEKKCQKIYGLSCNQINNWQENAKKECLSKNGGNKCNDPNYLETKYKPRTLKEKRLQATRNANRRKKEAKKQAERQRYQR